MSKVITYCEALNEAIVEEMERDSNVFVYGLTVSDHKRIFGTTNNLIERFGERRCFDTPVSEDAMLGMGIGAAMNGLRPINVHIRSDFVLLAMNQLINMASIQKYISAGQLSVPIVIRAVIGRGWGQGSQHSKSMQSVFAHFPGVKVIMPVSPNDVKGLMKSAIRDNGPVVCLEHRWLYWQEGEVTDDEIPLGIANVLRKGSNLTIVATSWMCVEASHAADILHRRGIEIEIIDPRTISPLDVDTIIESVRKTRRCLVADNDWLNCGFSAEVAAIVGEHCFNVLVSPVQRIGFTPTPCPTARHLENVFYPNAETLVRKIESMLGLTPVDLSNESFYAHEKRFKGPF